MQGKILAYSIDVNAGVISGEDGARYSFVYEQWHAPDENPKNGMLVKFNPVMGRAETITLDKKAA